MKLLEFTAALHEEIQKMIFPKCNMLEQVGIGLTLGMLDYKIGQLVSSNADFVRNLGLINETGEVNLDCVEHALLSGLSWPMKLGPFTFSTDDAKSIVSAIRDRVQKQTFGGH